jgi:methylmalonyl-CoA mutase
MTINGPAAILTGFFMNAAIDQQCEIYIKQNGLEKEVAKKMEAIFKAQKRTAPKYQGELPHGNDGLGLMLLGVTGDQVLPADIYEKIKTETLPGSARHGASRYFKRRSGPKYLYFQY